MKVTQRSTIGRTNLSVTSLGLGTAPLGNLYTAVGGDVASDTIRSAWQRGIRLFDTAPNYGFGVAEQRLGRVIRELPRDEFVLATKVGRLLSADAPPDSWQASSNPLYVDVPDIGQIPDYSYSGVMRSFEDSLKRLGVDRIDILHIHDPDDFYEEALTGAYRALDELRDQGVIRAVSAGMNQSAMLTRFAREADFDCFLLAGRYTLLDQSALHDLLPVCEAKGITIIAGGVYNSGILASPDTAATFDYRPARTLQVNIARRLEEVCRRHGVPLKAAAIQFPLAHPAVGVVLTGVRSPAEFEENAAMAETDIPDDLWSDLRSESLIDEAAPTPTSGG